jgi:hypothetical protein
MNKVTPSNESHYRLSKKVAQLTKVIARLNAVNENYAAQKHRIIEKEINDAKDQESKKQFLLEEEIRRLQDLVASSEVRVKEAVEQLVSVKREAQAKEVELQRNNEVQKTTHAETVRRMSLTFEEESRRYQESALCIRNELADGHKLRMEKLREEIHSSHEDEIQLLKARHEKNILRLERETLEQAKLAVENAVAKTRFEYENKLAQQLLNHDVESEGMRKEAKVLKEDLATVKLQVVEVARLRDDLADRIENESKLQLDVVSLQKSLDFLSSNHTQVVTELQTNIADLIEDLQTTKVSLQNRSDQNNSLEVDVRLYS